MLGLGGGKKKERDDGKWGRGRFWGCLLAVEWLVSMARMGGDLRAVAGLRVSGQLRGRVLWKRL